MFRRVVVFAAIALTACGPFRRGGSNDPVILFNNQSLNQADVYAVRSGGGGQDLRIGTVFSNRREALRVPALFTTAGDVTIVARMFASNRTPTSGPLSLIPGDTIEVSVANDERLLTVLPARPR